MTIKDRLKNRRSELDMTLEEVAQTVGVTRATIQKYENGIISNIPSDKIELLAKALKTTPGYLMGWDIPNPNIPDFDNIAPLPKMVRKPRLGTIACGKPILAVEDAEETDLVPENVDCDFTLRCKGDSMITARIFDGDIVYIRSQPEVENGQIAAVRIGDEATLKKVYYTPDSDRLILRACNPLYPDQVYTGPELDQVTILGLAVGFYSQVRHEM